MKICMVPDANLRFLRSALERMTVSCPRTLIPRTADCGERDAQAELMVVRRVIDDILIGNPNADCHSQHRANRGMLELACEKLVWLRTVLKAMDDPDIWKCFFEWESCDDEVEDEVNVISGRLSNVSRWDLDTCIEHLSREVLDRWEVGNESS